MRFAFPALLAVATLTFGACQNSPVDPGPDIPGEEPGPGTPGEPDPDGPGEQPHTDFGEAAIQVLESSGSTIIGTRHAGQTAPDLVRFTPDLTGFEALDDAASPWIELNATASPTTANRIVFQQGYPDTRIVEFVAGEPQPLTNGPAPAHQIWPQFTADGASIVFAGGDFAGAATSVWIVSAAGGDAELLWPSDDEVVSPSMSPSGDRIAFVSRNSSTLRIVDLEGDSIIASIGGVTMAKWSPTGDRIAMVRNGDLFTAAGDGSGLEYVASGQIPFTPRNLAWSPDGAWVVVHQAEDNYPWMGPLTLIEIDTGEMVTLVERTDVSQATWGL